MPSKKKAAAASQAAGNLLAEEAQLEKDLAKQEEDLAKLEEEIRADEEELRKGQEHLKALIVEGYHRFGMQEVLRRHPDLYQDIIQLSFGASGDPARSAHLIQNNSQQSQSIYMILRDGIEGKSSG